MITQVIDQKTQMISRLLEQYKDKPLIAAKLEIYAKQYLEAEAGLYGILKVMDLATATGYSLDIIGGRVGISRGVLSDTDYKSVIISQIAIQWTDSTIPSIINIFATITGADTITYTQQGPANYSIMATNIDPLITESLIKDVMVSISPAGVGVVTGKSTDDYFGFDEDINANTFGTLADANVGGIFAQLI